VIEVTHADREAAIKIFAMIFGNGHSATYALARSDRHFLFDELARHRIAARDAALEEAATELERQDGHGEWSEAATAIRALKGPTDDPA